MRMKACFIGGIVAIAAVAGIFEALARPRNRDEKEEEKEQGKEGSQQSLALL